MGTGVNKCYFLGRLGKDPKTGEKNGKAWASFSLAVDDSYKKKDGEKVDQCQWVNVVAYGKTAEIVTKYLHQGDQVFLECKYTQKAYEKDGQKRYNTSFVIDMLKMLGDKRKKRDRGDESDDGGGGEEVSDQYVDGGAPPPDDLAF
jgi:single-strand DNA-binding protein